MTLYALDGTGGTLDPAFHAHLLPLQTWATAWWQRWVPEHKMQQAFVQAELKLSEIGRCKWRAVTGPITAMIVSCQRIGWSMTSARYASDDRGNTWDFLVDSPAAIAIACKQSVRRWRFQRIAQHCPSLVPSACDVGGSQCDEGTIVVEFSGVISSLLRGASGKVSEVPAWCPKHKADLMSAISGGQWPQVRRAMVPRWGVTDNRCQLCYEALGTLEHRSSCRATCPSEGWPSPPKKAELILGRIG
eukprot:4119788-Karenia_brevis.AAC.1